MEKPTRHEVQKCLEEGRKARTWDQYWTAIDNAVKMTLLVVEADPEELADQFDEALGHKLYEGPHY